MKVKFLKDHPSGQGYKKDDEKDVPFGLAVKLIEKGIAKDPEGKVKPRGNSIARNEEVKELDDMTVKELNAYCESKGLDALEDYDPKAKKADLLDWIKENDK